MRRVPAILLLMVFSLPLIGPALWAQPDSNVPECCRRLGLHHCIQRGADSQTAGGAKWQPSMEKCPYFPSLPTSPAGNKAALRSASRSIAATLATVLVLDDRESIGHGFRFSSSHLKRGPPLA